jgi:hypothetical protein
MMPMFLLPGSGRINSKQGVKNNILIIIWKVEIVSGKCPLTLLLSFSYCDLCNLSFETWDRYSTQILEGNPRRK